MPTIPAYTINGITRPELHTDNAGHIILEPAAAAFAATYGSKALYLGLPAGTPFPPVAPTLSVPIDANASANIVAEGAAANTPVGLTVSATNVGGPAPTYSLTADSSGGGFQINPTTGVVTVANGALLDFESHQTYTVTAQATANGLVTSQSFTIAVGDVNDNAPVFTSGTTASTPENVATSTAVYTAHATDADGTAPNNTVHYSLASGVGDNDLFHINASTGAVTFIASPNFEAPQDQGADNIYDITVTASDGLPAHDVTRSVAITVTDVNETPVITSNGGGDTATVNLSEGTTAVTTVTATDQDLPPQALSFSVLTGPGSPDGASFTIDGGGHLSFIASPDFENPGSAANSNSYTVQVQVTDNGAPNAHDIQTITVNVQDLNDNAPTFTSSATPTVAENSTAVVTLGTTDPDTVGTNPATYSITGGADQALFQITGGNQLSFVAPRDYETQAHSYTVDVTASDGVNTTVQHLTVALSDVNDNAPIFSSGNSTSTPENVATNVAVYTAVAADADGTAANNTITYSLSSGGDNDLFSINPTTGAVTFNTSPDAENPTDAGANNVYDITVHAIDNNGVHDVTQAVAITVNDVNDNAPQFGSPTGSANVNEGASTATVVFDANATDADVTGANNTITYSLGGADAGAFAINPTTGEVTFAASPNFESPTDNGGDNVYDFTVTASDGVLAHDATQTVTITVANLPPSAPSDSDGAADQTYDNAPQGSSTGVQASATDPAGGAVTYSLLDDAGGRFAIDPVTGIVTVGATPIVFDTVTPANNAISITVRASDASGAHSEQSFVIDVLQDVPPSVTAGHTLNYTENDAATAVDSLVDVTDVDTPNLDHATVQITANYVNGEDILAFVDTPNIAGTFNPADGTLTLTGSDTVANYQAALRSVTYFNTSENPSGAARTVTFIANDGIANSTPATSTIDVTPVNDAPVVVAGHTLNYTENQAATAIDTAIAVSDVDNANLVGATVQITANYANGQDVLGFTNQNGITGSFNAATGMLTLTGSSSVANYQTALASVTYVNTSDNPSGLARTVTILTNDGTASSVAATDTINVTPVNDAPVTTAGGTLNYTENQAATAIDAGVTVGDVDSANLTSATVQITGNYANGQDILGFVNQNGITGSFNAATGTLTLTGSSSVANYQTALDSVTYFNNSDNPSGLDRTVTYAVNDGALGSNNSTATIHVTAVNDAPVLTAGATASFTENGAAATVTGSLTLTDADDTSLAGGAVVTLTNAQANDVLSVQGQGAATSGDLASGIHFEVDNTAHTVTFSNTDTVTDYQAALRLVQFSNTSEDPSTTTRTFTIAADDGHPANHSGSTSTTLAVVAVDDAPVNTVPADNAVATAFSNTDTVITGFSVADVDAEFGSHHDPAHRHPRHHCRHPGG